MQLDTWVYVLYKHGDAMPFRPLIYRLLQHLYLLIVTFAPYYARCQQQCHWYSCCHSYSPPFCVITTKVILPNVAYLLLKSYLPLLCILTSKVVLRILNH